MTREPAYDYHYPDTYVAELRAERDDWYMRALKAEHEVEVYKALVNEDLRAENEHLRTTLGYLADNIDNPALVAVAEAALKPRP